MAVPPKTTSQNDHHNGSSQGQASYPHTGHCSRCVRICIKCQQGTPHQSGFQLPPPVQQKQHPFYQCSTRLIHTNLQSNSFPGPVEKFAALDFDQPTRGSLQYEQLAQEDFQRERESVHRLLIQGKITEEATVDETTEKTSVLQSQRGSAPSTWQEASRLGRLEGERALDEEGMTETEPPQSLFTSEESVKELRSVTMQGNIQDLTLEDKREESAKSKESLARRERPPRDPRNPSGQDLKIRRAEQTLCQEVMNCLQKCSERLEVIQQSAQDCSHPQRRDTTDHPRVPMEPVKQTALEHTISKECSRTEQSASEAVLGCTTQQEMICVCTEPEKLPADLSLEHTHSSLNSSVSQLSRDKSESVASKQQTSVPPESDSPRKNSTDSKEQVATKQQQTSAHSDLSSVVGEQSSKEFTQISDSTTINCQLTRDNFCVYESEKFQENLQIQETGEYVQLKPEEMAPKDTISQHTVSQQPKRDLSTNASREQEQELSYQAEKVTSQQEPASEELPLQQEWASKKIPSHQEISLKNSASQQDRASKSSTSHQGSASKRTEYQEDATSRFNSREPVRMNSSQQNTLLKKAASQQSAMKQWSLQQERSSTKSASRQGSYMSKMSVLPLESGSVQKLLSAQSSESRAKFQPRQQIQRESVLLSRMSGKLNERLLRPTQSSAIISRDSKELKTNETVREITRQISDLSKAPLSPDRNLDQELTVQKSDIQQALAPASVPDERSIARVPSTVTMFSDTSKTRTPVRDKSPPTSDKFSSKEIDMPKKTDETTVEGTTLKAKTSNMVSPSKQSNQKLLPTDGSQPHRKQSSISDQKSFSSGNLDQTGSGKPQAYCLHACYLPLYQCAYCQHITPYPVTCQMGLVSCCPSPFSLCHCQPEYMSDSPSRLPCSCQAYTLPYLPLNPLPPGRLDQKSPSNHLQLCPQPLYPYGQSPCHEPIKLVSQQSTQCQLPCFQPIEPCPRSVSPCPQPSRQMSYQLAEGSQVNRQISSEVANGRSAPIQHCQQSCPPPAQNTKINRQRSSELGEPFLEHIKQRQQPCSRPEQCQNQCSEQAKLNKNSCQLSCENVACPSSGSSLDRTEPCACQGLGQPSRSSTSGGSGGGGGNKRSSVYSDQSSLEQSLQSKLANGPVSSSTTKQVDGSNDTYEVLKGEDTERSTADRTNSINGPSRTGKKRGGSEGENHASGGKTNQNVGRDEVPRREAAYRKGSYEKNSNMNTFLGKRGKFRLGKAVDSLEEMRGKGCTKSRRSPHKLPSTESTVLSNTTLDGKSRNRRAPNEESQAGRKIGAKITQGADKDDRRKTGRSLGQSLFERVGVSCAGSHRDISTTYPLSSSIQTSIRKLQLVQPKREILSRIGKMHQSKKDMIAQISSIPSDPRGLQSCAREESLTSQDSSSRKSNAHSQAFARSDKRSAQKIVMDASDGQKRTKTPSFSSVTSSVNTAFCSRNYKPRSQRYLDRENRNNIFSPYYLSPSGAPHRAVYPIKGSKFIKRLQLRVTNTPQFSNDEQTKNPHLLPLDVSSKAEDSASYQSEDPNLSSALKYECFCEKWLNKAAFPECHNCCGHVWPNDPHCICSLQPHHFCPNASTRTGYIEDKPMAHRSQRTRHILSTGKHRLAEQKLS